MAQLIEETPVRFSRLTVSAAAAVTAFLCIGAASAADLAVKAPYAAAPAFSWTGCYVGVHAGAGVLLDQGFDNSAADRHGVGGLAGGQIGCNYQTGMLVVGIEGEGFWSGMRVTQDQFFGPNNALSSSATIKNKWDYDIAGRFGVAIERALVYGKAGWVLGGFDWNFAPVNGTSRDQGNATLNGLLIGVGMEYAFTNNWTTKFEYDYLGFGAKNVTFNSFCPSCNQVNATFVQSVSADKHIFKVGINYKFF